MLDALAVKVTEAPGQIAPEGDAVKLTAGVMVLVTWTVIEFEVAVFELKHVPPVIVIEQVTTSLLISDVEVKLLEVLF